MTEPAKVVTVDVSEKGKPIVTFTGTWTRRDIEQAHATMLRELPVHISKLKKEAQDAR